MLINNQADLLGLSATDSSSCSLKSLFTEDKQYEIKMLYTLYKPIKDGLKPVADIYKSHLID